MSKWKKTSTKAGTIEEYFLNNMGVTSITEVNEIFQKSYDDGYVIKDMDKAVALIQKHKGNKIVIFGDYDADGITSTSIFVLGLRRLGYKVAYRIPKRHSEGFGLNKTMVDEAVSNGVNLVITCDNGVAQLEVVAYAKSRGLDVLITDHHEASVDGLPLADVIIDPNAVKGQCEFAGYCGAGIAYKVVRALLKAEDINDKQLLDKCLSLAAVGTVADVMELKEENYVIVKNGMKKLQNPRTTTLPMYALACAFGLEKHMSAKDIGFKLGPVINAQSRLNDNGAMTVVDYLINEDRPYNEICKLCEKFITTNDRRKILKKEYQKMADDYISDNCLFGECPLIVKIDDCLPGIIGIVSGYLAEKYKVPNIVLCREDGVLKGSARSIGNYDMKAELDKVADLLVKHGGHKEACGLTLLEENFDKFVSTMVTNAPEITLEVPEDAYDFEIDAKNISKFVAELEKYEPWGNGNPMPVFKVVNFEVLPKAGAWTSVVNETILKINGTKACAIGFDMVGKVSKEPKKLNLLGQISNNYFNGNITPQIEFTAVEEIGAEKKTTPLAAMLASMAK